MSFFQVWTLCQSWTCSDENEFNFLIRKGFSPTNIWKGLPFCGRHFLKLISDHWPHVGCLYPQIYLVDSHSTITWYPMTRYQSPRPDGCTQCPQSSLPLTTALWLQSSKQKSPSIPQTVELQHANAHGPTHAHTYKNTGTYICPTHC